jgi:uncharacterized cupredoxin-like copper-binding protein
MEVAMTTLLKSVGAGFAVAMLVSQVALANDTAHVTLLDKAEGVDFSKPMGLGVGMKGDMSKAIMSIAVNKKVLAQGKITFNVVNNSKTVVHEVIVAPLASAANPLPFKELENVVDEEAAKSLGEVAELDPGKSGSVTLDLKPGAYILYCNVPGHYMAGMWTTVTVK